MASPAPAPSAAVGGAGGPVAPVAYIGPPAYTFFGHSYTVGPILKIPDGCILVTLALCGDASYFDVGYPIYNFANFFSNPANAQFIANPIFFKGVIERAIGAPIGINYPGAARGINEYYMDVQFNSELTHVHPAGAVIPGDPNPLDTQSKCYLHRSGLYHSGTGDLRPHIVNYNDLETNKLILKNEINWMYTDSLYPPRMGVIAKSAQLNFVNTKGFNRIKEIGTHFKIRQSELFDRFPGIHYLVTCRVTAPTADPMVGFNSGLRRTGSRGPNVTNYDHNPIRTDPFKPLHRKHRGYIGSKYRLPPGVSYTNYIYSPNKRAIVIEKNATGRETIQIVKRGGSRLVKTKRRSKGKRKYTYKHKK